VIAALAVAGVIAGRALGTALPPRLLHAAFSVLLLVAAGCLLAPQ
jgi:hypothetical protein